MQDKAAFQTTCKPSTLCITESDASACALLDPTPWPMHVQDASGLRAGRLHKPPLVATRTARQAGSCHVRCALTLAVPPCTDSSSSSSGSNGGENAPAGHQIVLDYAAQLLSPLQIEAAEALQQGPGDGAEGNQGGWVVADGQLVGERMFQFQTQRVEYEGRGAPLHAGRHRDTEGNTPFRKRLKQ